MTDLDDSEQAQTNHSDSGEAGVLAYMDKFFFGLRMMLCFLAPEPFLKTPNPAPEIQKPQNSAPEIQNPAPEPQNSAPETQNPAPETKITSFGDIE